MPPVRWLERASSDLCFTRKPLALLLFSPAESGLALKRSTRCTFCLTYSYLWVSVRWSPWPGTLSFASLEKCVRERGGGRGQSARSAVRPDDIRNVVVLPVQFRMLAGAS